MFRLKKYLTIFLLTLGVGIPSIVQAQEESKGKDWNFIIAPYIYNPFISGDVKINDHSTTLSNETSIGGMFAFEVYNPKWSIYTDILSVNHTTNVTLPFTQRVGEFEISTRFLGVYSMWRVKSWFELGFGGRLVFNNSNLMADSNGNFNAIDAESNSVMFDPLLVMRFTFLKNDHWNISMRGDVGGFGFYSIITYMVNPVVGYRISDLLEINMNYRLLSLYQDDVEGRDKFDLKLYGPQVGLLFHF